MSDISDSIAKPPVRRLKNAMQETHFKTFSWEEQRHFARVSGDFNPVHMDDVAARRTQAGKAVVHGMHLALWGLDRLIQDEVIFPLLAGFKARFTKMVYVEETASLAVVRDDGTLLTAQVRVGNAVVATLSISRGPLEPATGTCAPGVEREEGDGPVELKLEDLNGKSGTVAFAHGADSLFPSAARALGATRIQAIATISRLVGMVCPGLHSIAYSYRIAFTEAGEGESALAFQVEEVDERFRVLTQAVWGGGVKGTVVALARVPPVAQRLMSDVAKDVAKFVTPAQFQGVTALVIGGSRGLGELTAKILAAGGASVVITYAVGQQEALAVRDEIRAFGASAETMQYDARLSATEQLNELSVPPTHLYYFATSAIFRRVDGVFSKAVFEDFCRFYIAGFHDLCEHLMKGRREPLHVLYPSSVAVAERPAGLTEYAMAKAGGELLCEDLNRGLPLLKITVARLPRILTDQTATTTDVESADALQTMLPLVQASLC